ncbi:MAG: hypothetical protein KGJ98_13165 [Chloroflexota bacterium]|nr:hypothetical protein [Chloroflexota bacterium]
MSVPLREPPGTAAAQTKDPHHIEAASGSVAKGWDRTVKADAKAAARAFAYLRDHPFQRYPGRCFPLRGPEQRGVWQYEVNDRHRLRYSAVKGEARLILVLYAGDYH